MFIELAGHDKNRKQQFLEEMEREIPWDFIVEEISKYWEESKIGRKKYPLKKISRIRGKVEHPFGVIKNIWGHRSCRYKGLHKNNLQWNFLAMLSNFYMLARGKRFQ